MERNSHLFDKDTWCVIPVFNNAGTVRSIAEEARKYISNILVVDDGSTDADIKSMLSGTDVEVLRHEKNMGKGKAILTALDHLKKKNARFMITIDADGQHYPKDLEKISPLLCDDTIVIGNRKFDSPDIPDKSKYGRTIASFWMRIETGISAGDCQSGFRAYPVKYISRLNLSGTRYEFETEILAKAVWAGLKIHNVDIDVWYPEKGERVSGFRPLADNLRISLMHARLVGRNLLPLPHKKLIPRAPSHMDMEILKHPVKLLKKLLKENASPLGLAVSAGVGIFLAVLPLISIHTLVIIYVTSKLHLNRIMACAIQNLCIPPFVPVICVEIGHYLLHGKWINEVSFDVIFRHIPDRIYEWFLGSLIAAPLFAVITGILVYFLSAKIQKRYA